eukprot:2165298-Pyramimonas_sp.AAC.1
MKTNPCIIQIVEAAVNLGAVIDTKGSEGPSMARRMNGHAAAAGPLGATAKRMSQRKLEVKTTLTTALWHLHLQRRNLRATWRALRDGGGGQTL